MRNPTTITRPLASLFTLCQNTQSLLFPSSPLLFFSIPPVPSLPPAFLLRMKTLLGEEYDAFLASYDAPPEVGLRVNTLKLSPAEFQTVSPFLLEPLLWTDAGFRVLETEDRPGLHPYHAAGLYYLQEPSAQAVAEILDPQPGERILDLAAAPGGKTTHIAAKMENQGVLVANEIHPKRVWDLTKNLERWGARNTLITNETPERLADALPEYFDRVLVDAPCSGEGMFRKTPEATRDWSPEFVAGCALRQTVILDTAAQLVRPGGWLCYATCTFAPEENEHVIARFLETYPEFSLITPSRRPGFSSSPFPLFPSSPPLTNPTPVRLYPHRAPGEGHFITLMQRTSPPLPQRSSFPLPLFSPSRSLRRLLPFWDTFTNETLILRLNPHQLRLVKSYLYYMPLEAPDLTRLRLIRPGWWLGSFKKDRFEPSHALAMALTPEEAQRVLPLNGPDALAYLRRETLRLSPSGHPDGWTLVTLDHFPLGWGKMVKGILKNHLPAGLRMV